MPDPADPSRLTADERLALEALDREWLVATLSDVIAYRSLAGDETPAQERIAAELARLGMAVDAWTIDTAALSAHPSYSAEVDRRDPLGVVGWLGDSGPSLLLNGHIDVVPAGDPAAWTAPPWQATIRDGALIGRGAVDMKGGLVCALAAVKALGAARLDPPGRVGIASVVGEEDGGTGTLATVLRGHTGDAAVIMEPTDGYVVPAHAGALTFRLVVPGAAAHGAVRREGVSALEKLTPIHDALMALEAERNGRVTDELFSSYELPIAISIGTVHAGDWSATVPDRLVCEGRYGVAVGEDLSAARRQLENAVAAAAAGDAWLANHPPTVEWWGGQFAPAAIPADHAIVRTVGTAHGAITGTDAAVRGVPYGADLGLLVNEGATPTIMYGPGDVRLAHRADEAVPLADLEVVAQTLILTILRFAA